MKRTLTVNLGGTVFCIDEDAYTLLSEYLENLRYHFRNQEGADEMVRDMEMRISELFTEGLEGGQQVITVDNVEWVIARMGKPEEMDGSKEGTQDASSNEEEERVEPRPEERPKKQFFRNPDNRVLGGVLSGISVLMGWDVAVLRLIVIFLALIGNLGIPILMAYLLAWVIVPSAETAAERLKMKGEKVNMENIGKTVTDSFNQEQEGKDKPDSRSPFLKFADAVAKIAGLLVKVFLIFILVCCVPALLCGMFVLFMLILFAAGFIVTIPAFISELLPYIEWSSVGTSSASMILFIVCGLLVAGIPLAGVLQLVFQSFGNWKPMSSGVKVGLVILWIVALIAGFIFLFHASFIAESPHFLCV